jgi:hypothetical protein
MSESLGDGEIRTSETETETETDELESDDSDDQDTDDRRHDNGGRTMCRMPERICGNC